MRPEYDLSQLEGGVRGKYYQEATAGTNLVLIDEDEGVAEALRRDDELEADPDQAFSLAELDSHIHGRRR